MDGNSLWVTDALSALCLVLQQRYLPGEKTSIIPATRDKFRIWQRELEDHMKSKMINVANLTFNLF